MMRSARLICAFLTFTLARPVLATDRHWHAGAGAAVRHFRFDEFDSQGTRLVREQGPLPGVLLSGGYTGSGWDASMTAAGYSGQVDYDGQTQSGQPLKSDSDETFYELGALARYRLLRRAAVSLHLVAGADARLWQRRIQGTSNAAGLDEDWRWQQLGFGAACDYRTAAAGVFAVQARILRTLQPQIDVRFHSGFDDATLNLDGRYGWRLDASWSGKLSSLAELQVAGFLEQRELGRSADETLNSGGVPVGTLLQPQTETREAGISVQLVHYW